MIGGFCIAVLYSNPAAAQGLDRMMLRTSPYLRPVVRDCLPSHYNNHYAADARSDSCWARSPSFAPCSTHWAHDGLYVTWPRMLRSPSRCVVRARCAMTEQ